jgi:hypothetical protein
MLVSDVPTMQLIAYTTLTAASVTVAVVASIFSYYQNYGWTPVILVLAQWFGDDAGIDFEFWNRRKYPVVIHVVEIRFGNVKLDEPPPPSERWAIFHNKLIHRGHVSLEPASHHPFEAAAMYKKQTLSKSEIVRIDVFYFDPIANRRKKLTSKHRYKYTEEG